MDLQLASRWLNRDIVGFSVARIRCSPSCWPKAKPWNRHLFPVAREADARGAGVTMSAGRI